MKARIPLSAALLFSLGLGCPSHDNPSLSSTQPTTDLDILDSLPIVWPGSSEQEGVDCMRPLVRDSEQEEVFVYLRPTNIWLSVGTQAGYFGEPLEGSFGQRVSVKLDSLRNHLIRHPDVTHISFYHFHPDTQHELAISRFREAYGRNGSGQSPQQFDPIPDLVRIVGQMPSSADIAACINETTWLNQCTPPISCTHKVVGTEGVMSYDLSEDGIRHYLGLSKQGRAQASQEQGLSVEYTVYQVGHYLLVEERLPPVLALDSLTEFLRVQRLIEAPGEPRATTDTRMIFHFQPHRSP